MAELRAKDHVLMTMANWKDVLNRYMELNNKDLLLDAGTSHASRPKKRP